METWSISIGRYEILGTPIGHSHSMIGAYTREDVGFFYTSNRPRADCRYGMGGFGKVDGIGGFLSISFFFGGVLVNFPHTPSAPLLYPRPLPRPLMSISDINGLSARIVGNLLNWVRNIESEYSDGFR